MDYVLAGHARDEMIRRQISPAWVDAVMASPEQIIDGYGNRKVYQSRIASGGRTYLIRLIVEADRQTPVVITMYRTSKLEKYWRTP